MKDKTADILHHQVVSGLKSFLNDILVEQLLEKFFFLKQVNFWTW